MNPKFFTGAVLGLVLIAAVAAYVYADQITPGFFRAPLEHTSLVPTSTSPSTTDSKQSEAASTLSGTIECLPHKGDGPHTMECAIGLKGDDGKHYALTMFNYPDQADVGEHVQLIGVMVTSEEFHLRYDIVGTFQVASVTKL